MESHHQYAASQFHDRLPVGLQRGWGGAGQERKKAREKGNPEILLPEEKKSDHKFSGFFFIP